MSWLSHGRSRRTVVTLAIGLAALLSSSAPHVLAEGHAEDRVVPPIYRMMYLSDDSDRRIAATKEKLIADCMAAHGLSYTTHVEDVTEDEARAALRPFGLETLEDFATEPLPPEPVQDDEYVLVLFGDPGQRVVARGERLEISLPATGCQAEAERRLLGDHRQRATELRLRLYDGERDAREQLDRDPTFTSATGRWRTCMRHSGVEASNPTELLGALPAGTDVTTHPVARADVRCKRDTGYLDTAYARLAALQQTWLDTHAALVGEWLAHRQRQDTVARRLLGPG